MENHVLAAFAYWFLVVMGAVFLMSERGKMHENDKEFGNTFWLVIIYPMIVTTAYFSFFRKQELRHTLGMEKS